MFAWKPRRDSDEPAVAGATRDVIGHFIDGEPAPGDGGILPFVYVDDVDVVLRRVEQQGGSLVGSARHEGILRLATFPDPEANLIGPWTESTT